MSRATTTRLGMATVAMLGVLALVVAACGGEVDTAPQPTATTTTATITTPITTPTTTETISQEILLTFDGEQCLYEGPSQGVLSEPLNMTLVNNTDTSAAGAVLWVPPDLLGEVMQSVGTDFPFSPGGLTEGGTFRVEVSARSEGSVSAAVAAPGTYVLDCASLEGGAPVHIFRPAAIEISP